MQLVKIKDACNVLAVHSSIGSNLQNVSRTSLEKKSNPYTSAEAELMERNEARPLVVLKIVAETIAENKTTNRIPISISAMRIKFSSPGKVKFKNLTMTKDTSTYSSPFGMFIFVKSPTPVTCT